MLERDGFSRAFSWRDGLTRVHDRDHDAGAANPRERCAAQLFGAPADLLRREPPVAERLVLGDEEIAADEPLADDDAAEDRETGDREGRIERDRADATPYIRERVAAPPPQPRGDDQRADRQRPRFVPRETRERECDADGCRADTRVRPY